MTGMFTIVLLVLAGIFAALGGLWFFGKGGGLMNGYNSMDRERKARIDEKAFLRFNGIVALIVAGIVAICALLNHIGQTWAFTVAIVSVLVMVGINVLTMRSKRFIKKDAPEVVDKDDPKKKRERKAKLILSAVVIFVVGISIGWLMLEGVRPINASVSGDELRIRGFYGMTIELSDIVEIELDERAITAIGTGGRRAGHGTNNNLRGRFGAGQMLIQNPEEGPTIRIDRRNDTAVFISHQNPTDTRALYQQIRSALN